MKVAAAALLLAAGASAQTTHRTNSYLHPEERDYPLDRPGHVRTTNQTAPLAEKSVASRMAKMHLMEHKQDERADARAKGMSPQSKPFLSDIKCVDGKAGEFDCNNVDLLSFIPLAELGSSREASDSWGWVDPETMDEIAIIVMEDTTTFVQVTDPKNPVVLGTLPQSGSTLRIWSDVKVYANHAYIIREVNHGVQAFDLTDLREFYNTPSAHVRVLNEDHVYREVTSVHNVVINEQTAFAYSVGSTTCRGGLHAIDISDPKKPKFAGCYSDDGYTHDAQIVVYNGPDTRYTGHEIAFCFNENTVTIVDVSDKGNMIQLSRTPYNRNMYTHQGWLTEDHATLASNDELDESYGFGDQEYTRTLLWDVTDLENPVLTGEHIADVKSIDHNLYVRDNKVFASQYTSGLRVLDASDMINGVAPELAFFDTAPYSNGSPVFQGTWSNYPFFPSGNVVVSNIETGLFMLKVNVD